MESELPLRIVIVAPPPGVMFCVQSGDAELVAPVRSTGKPLAFDFAVKVRDGTPAEEPRLTGPFVKGPSNGKFVYVNSGTLAGQADSRWTRRAKVPLGGITRQLMDKARDKAGARLEARIDGIAMDGGPACATVALLGRGWELRTTGR